MERVWRGHLVSIVYVAVWAVSSGYWIVIWWALLNLAVCANRAAIVWDNFWAVVNFALWALSSGYGEGQLVVTGECGGKGCIERLWRGTFGAALVNVSVWAVSSGYGKGHLVGTGECGCTGCIEQLLRGTVGGHW